MAAIGKIRSWGTVLVCVIGLALFAFIAEELVRSTDSMRNDSRQQVGEVLGKKISVQEFQALLDEYLRGEGESFGSKGAELVRVVAEA